MTALYEIFLGVGGFWGSDGYQPIPAAPELWWQQMWQQMWRTLVRLFLKHTRALTRGLIWALVTGIPVSVVVVVWVQPWLEREDRRYVAVVLSGIKVDAEPRRESITYAQLSRDLFRGFEDRLRPRAYFETGNAQRVDIEILDDGGSTEAAKLHAERLMMDDRCLLVLGGSNSTRTSAILDVFIGGRRAAHRPGLIMPIATADPLTVRAAAAEYEAVLRMLPPDKRQAATIAMLIGAMAKQRQLSQYTVAMYADPDNPIYSKNILREMADQVRDQGGRVSAERFFGPDDSFADFQALWSGGTTPDFVIYAGEPHYGRLMCDRLVELEVSVPVIFTDGCMSRRLLEYASDLPNDAFITFPLGNSGEGLPSYEPIGQDAYDLINKIIGKMSNRTRGEVVEIIRNIRQKGDSIMQTKAGSYVFDSKGENKGLAYHVFRIVPPPKLLKEISIQ